jgi:hypothetical protein
LRLFNDPLHYLQNRKKMNTGRLSVICFVLLLVALFGVNAGFEQENSLIAIASAAVAVLSFVYAMYLGLMAIRKGDPWLRRRGESGTAEILSGDQTRWAMAAGEYYGIGAPAIWKYKLEVTRPGHGPYRTILYICAHLGHSGTIPVRISRWNHKRVTFDPDAAGSDGPLGDRSGREQEIQEALAERGR